jgi:GTP-binding protein HflX
VCLDTIQTIGATGVPVITVLNKVDILKEEELQQKVSSLRGWAPTPVPVSALKGTNLSELKQMIMRYLTQSVQASFSIPMKNELTPFIAWLSSRAEVQSLRYEADGVHGVFESIPWFAEKVRERVIELGGTFQKT